VPASERELPLAGVDQSGLEVAEDDVSLQVGARLAEEAGGTSAWIASFDSPERDVTDCRDRDPSETQSVGNSPCRCAGRVERCCDCGDHESRNRDPVAEEGSAGVHDLSASRLR
jgi:hypothetical protein